MTSERAVEPREGLTKALVEAVMPLEVIAGQDRVKPYREMSRDFIDTINRAIGVVRAALAATPAPREDGWEELRREIAALPGVDIEVSRVTVPLARFQDALTLDPAKTQIWYRDDGEMVDRAAVLAIVDRAAAARGESGLREALRGANAIIAMTREHLAKDHPDCAYTGLGLLNDASRAALATPTTPEPDPER